MHYLNSISRRHHFLLILVSILCLSACAPYLQSNHKSTNFDGPPLSRVDLSGISDAEPRYEPLSPYGNPKKYTVMGKTYTPLQRRTQYTEQCIASWYGRKFHGRLTSSREPYDMLAMSAAHKTLPLPSYVAVTNKLNGKKIVVRINDRGPFASNRIIDLSYAAAAKLGIIDKGTAPVKIETILPPPTSKPQQPNDIYIQVGAFTQKSRAIKLSDQLNTKFSTRITKAHHQGKVLYRVHSGPFVNRNQAWNAIESLSKMGYDAQLLSNRRGKGF